MMRVFQLPGKEFLSCNPHTFFTCPDFSCRETFAGYSLITIQATADGEMEGNLL